VLEADARGVIILSLDQSNMLIFDNVIVLKFFEKGRTTFFISRMIIGGDLHLAVLVLGVRVGDRKFDLGLEWKAKIQVRDGPRGSETAVMILESREVCSQPSRLMRSALAPFCSCRTKEKQVLILKYLSNNPLI
jgi:hypothetical protein